MYCCRNCKILWWTNGRIDIIFHQLVTDKLSAGLYHIEDQGLKKKMTKRSKQEHFWEMKTIIVLVICQHYLQLYALLYFSESFMESKAQIALIASQKLHVLCKLEIQEFFYAILCWQKTGKRFLKCFEMLRKIDLIQQKKLWVCKFPTKKLFDIKNEDKFFKTKTFNSFMKF